LLNYTAIILMLATMQGAIAFGFVYSMVLVDEKDTSVAKVYGVLPVSKFWFVVFRLIPPFLLATLTTFLLLLVEPFYKLPRLSILVYSALAGLVSPLMILFVSLLAKNKIEAMTWQKLFNVPLFLPILAFFAPATFSLFFAISPTFWAYQGFHSLILGKEWLAYTAIGFIHSALFLGLCVRRFTRTHFT
jgi:fluoroquinolone transport system permease protein